jgi:hypothetical protein
MRDYQRIATLIDHDESMEPGAPRFCYFFDTPEEAIAQLARDQQLVPTTVADLLDWRWYGWNREAIITVMNTAFFQFANYPLFINGYDGFSLGPARTVAIFVESPRSDGFNSLSEES